MRTQNEQRKAKIITDSDRAIDLETARLSLLNSTQDGYRQYELRKIHEHDSIKTKSNKNDTF